MADLYDEALAALQRMAVLPESEQPEFYDETIDPLIERAANETRERPTEDNIRSWLRIQAAAFGLAVEGISDVTAELHDKHQIEFERALRGLPSAQSFSIDLLLQEFRGEEFLSDEILKERRTLPQNGSMSSGHGWTAPRVPRVGYWPSS